jgi:type VI secretion system protein ImpC
MSNAPMHDAEQATTFAAGGSDFASLLQQEFKPKTDKARDAIDDAVRTLAAQALAGTALVSGDVLGSIEGLIAGIDAKLSEQINHVLHHREFQAVESAWRGLHYLVTNTESDESLKIRVMNVSKQEMARTLRKFKGVAWDQSPIFKKLYEEEYGQFGGEPYGAFVADYYFDHNAPDVELLANMAQVAAAAHAPLITAADPSAMLMESWQELANPRDLTKIFQTPEHAAWRSFRASDDARYVGLAMPRFLAP